MKISVYKKQTKNILLMFNVFSLVFFITFIILSPPKNESPIILIGVIILAISPILFYFYLRLQGYYGAYVIIDNEGVKFYSNKKNVFFGWEDISEIGLTTSTYIKGIGISTKYNFELLTTNVAIEKISSSYIFIEFRLEAYSEIRKYWNKEIENENQYKTKGMIK